MEDSSVEFYAVSCAAERTLCDEFKIHGTPTVMAFAEDGDEGKPLPGVVTKERIIQELKLGEAQEELRNLQREKREDELDGAQMAEEQDDDNPLDEPGDFVEEPPQEPEDDDKKQDQDYYQQEEEEEEEEAKTDDDEDSDDDGPVDPIEGRDEDPWFPQGAEESVQHREGGAGPLPFVRKGVQAAREKTRARREQDAPAAVRDTFRARVAASQGKTKPLFMRKPRVQDGFDARQIPEEGATKTMKAHQLNTIEFRERRSKLLQQIEQRKGKKAREAVEKRMNDVLNKRIPIPEPEIKAKRPFTKDIGRTKIGERIPIVKRMVKMNNEESLMLDTTLAFIEGLTQGLFRKDASLTAAERTALADWLQLLSVALPQEWGLHELIDALMARKTFISQSRQNMLQVITEHAPKRRLYSPSCRSTKIPFNCGFWKLLHTVCELFRFGYSVLRLMLCVHQKV